MKNNGDWLEISDLDKFTDYIRNVVYISFKDEGSDEEYYEIDINKGFENLTNEEEAELENILDKKECINIIKETSRKMRNKKTKKVKYLMDDRILYEIIENINQRMVSNIISNLVKKGLLESAFDEEKNDFVFWKKENKDGNSQT